MTHDHGGAAAAPPGAFAWRNGLAYGALGLPLAFVALPLYVTLPNHYARSYGLPLATLGAILLGARLLDALVDPALGSWGSRLYARSLRSVLAWGAACALVLAGGFALLFFPPVREPAALAWWAGAGLVLTYAAYSALGILHQSWGAMLGGSEWDRSRIVAWREGLGLVGVLVASVTPVLWGLGTTTALFALLLLAGWLAWTRAIEPPRACGSGSGGRSAAHGGIGHPLRQRGFRQLLAVFLLNGIASAIPATLVLFFVQDRLQAPPPMEAAFLGCYFLCAALSIPLLWLRLVPRWGLARCWLAGMLLAVAVFASASLLGPGDSAAFLFICGLSGVALGSDVALPGALLAGVIQQAGDRGRNEGVYFGWWNFATKLNLALAAGLALPALGAWGYVPGSRDDQALAALTAAYCLLPCLLKLLAAAALYFFNLRRLP